MITIGILKEGKSPPDRRVALIPEDIKALEKQFPSIQFLVQSSDIRCISDEEYRAKEIQIVEDLSDCDVLFGVKEVPKHELLPDKTYFFFSHTIKEQPYNKALLQKMIALNIRMIDYEVLTKPSGSRLIGFGRYAGIVGAYNACLTLGKRTGLFLLKPAHDCEDFKELQQELKKVVLPNGYKIVLTGRGRVAFGAEEILSLVPGLERLEPEQYLLHEGKQAVFTRIDTVHYLKRKNDLPFCDEHLQEHPEDYSNAFLPYAHSSDMFVAGHFYGQDAPFFFTREDAKEDAFRIRVVADISCDIDGPVASTIKPSTIADPIYGYNRFTENTDDFTLKDVIAVMAVDNLPCELPKDASMHFSSVLSSTIIPLLVESDPEHVLDRATICADGKLGKHFEYLNEYAFGK